MNRRKKKGSERGYQRQELHAEITEFTKLGGPLTKHISLADDGSLRSDGSACRMACGRARRVKIASVEQLAALIGQLHQNQAISLGTLRTGLPDQVKVVTKAKLPNGAAHPNIIARTGSDIVYRKGEPAFALFDFDTKGMPPRVVAELKRFGGFREALLTLLPALRGVARLTRRSTSAGLFRSDTGEQFAGSDGQHVYPLVQDGDDVERFLKALHERCWLAGLGWMMVGTAGQLLERSIVDRTVAAPERLVFEGPPILELPLQQDRESRRPVVSEGDVLDTVAACPPLSVLEKAKLDALKEREIQRLAPERAKARAAFVERQAKRIVERTGMPMRAATRIVVRQCEGVLVPAVVLPFDDEEFAGCTVGDVLADPERFDGAELADPLEGVEYGRGKAKVMRRPDGTPWIHSFAHGRTVYQLRLDASAVRAAVERADSGAAVRTLIEFAVAADLDDQELRNFATWPQSAAAPTSERSLLCSRRHSASTPNSTPSKNANVASPSVPIPVQ